MGPLLIFAMFVVSLALQGSVLALVGTSGVHPDILLVLVVVLGLLSDTKHGALAGLAAGLLQDVMFGSPLGFFAFINMLTGALAGMLADEVNKDFMPAPVMLVAFFTVFSGLLAFMLTRFYSIPQPHSFVEYMQQVSL
ncbi:MAG: rod shape-determining protein MreD, partial [Bacillota bacterium]|nr:rod shape-determining protein MreD [Bacillota bacterium]